ncbi:tigger transposable element-derived protein 4-like [Cimex lectularius]|uniref:HTH CENPB-type domain-containing protein n=1 Tax=Cimex lectularius TaxID=79782 RepID=A0A8I6RS32_CIMLE|nr:tigger transposable element-derived protein 4-like [Cimex lectularius]
MQRRKHIPISGPILQAKGNEFARILCKEDFQCSMSWITRFRVRHNIVFGKISGESSSVPAGVSENWLQCIWPITRENFADEDIYYADETGLFYRLTPDKTLRFKGESCHGGKHSKERVTVLVASNMTGTDKKKLLIIGKSKSPRCFKNVQKLPLDYTHNKKAWMTSEIISDWLRKWDEELQKKKRKILLTVDNCPSHPSVPNPKNIELYFLPPNTTSVLQPMDQGIIKNLKVKFRQRLVLKMLDQPENFKVSLLDAILMISDSWDDVTQKTIQNCFRHGFGKDETRTDQEDDVRNFNEWAQELDFNFHGDAVIRRSRC